MDKSKMVGGLFVNSVSMNEVIAPINGKGGLYLGDINAAKAQAELESSGIGCVVTVVLYDPTTTQVVPDTMQHLIVPAEDTKVHNIRQYFDQSNQFIQDNLEKTNVLVHCMAGISRSTAILMAYLIKKNNWTYQQTFDFIHEKRQNIGPNEGFVDQLKQYSVELKIDQ